MTKPYDATMKQLLYSYAPDWLGWLGPRLGIPATTQVESVDVDLSMVQYAVDKVFRLKSPVLGYLHLEFQASSDLGIPDRMLLYNALLEAKYGGPVYSALLLLRREAQASSITGTVTRKYPDGHVYFQFNYSVVRVWELSGEALLNGSVGTIPLALLTDDAVGHLREWVLKVDRRISEAALHPSLRSALMFSSRVLSGLRYNAGEVNQAFMGVHDMKESSVYQEILKEGEERGRLEGEERGRLEGEERGRLKERDRTRSLLAQAILSLLRDRFGKISSAVETQIQSISDESVLQSTILRVNHISNPDDLLL